MFVCGMSFDWVCGLTAEAPILRMIEFNKPVDIKTLKKQHNALTHCTVGNVRELVEGFFYIYMCLPTTIEGYQHVL